MKECVKCGSTQNKFPRQGRQCQPCVNANGYAQKAAKFAHIRLHIEKVKSVPCTDCGLRFPTFVMDFDHIVKKSFNIADYQRMNKSLDDVKSEIEKCEVVCANCHRIRTFSRLVVY